MKSSDVGRVQGYGEIVDEHAILIAENTEMCSRHEARERERTGQLDKFEWAQGSGPLQPEVNFALATRKYQRSSAGKSYEAKDVRTVAACWKTMEFLLGEILDFDCNPKPGFAVTNSMYIDVYSYLRDRTRAVRVDLHLQANLCDYVHGNDAARIFLRTHECCLRFELLSFFLLAGGVVDVARTEKYDERLALQSISQTIGPLLEAYRVRGRTAILRTEDGPKIEDVGGVELEFAIHRYVILVMMSFASSELPAHLARLDRPTLSHPLVKYAVGVYAAFATGDYGRFLACYREADFLTAVAMSGVADVARLRTLWLMARACPQSIADRVPLSSVKHALAFASDAHARNFLAVHGVEVVDEDESAKFSSYLLFPKKGTEAALGHLLLTGPLSPPEVCHLPRGQDSLLIAKFDSLNMCRCSIVMGNADPKS